MSRRALLRRIAVVAMVAGVLAVAGAEQLALVCVGLAVAVTALELFSQGSLDPHIKVIVFITVLMAMTATAGVYLVVNGRPGLGVLLLLTLPLGLLAIRHEVRILWRHDDDASGD